METRPQRVLETQTERIASLRCAFLFLHFYSCLARPPEARTLRPGSLSPHSVRSGTLQGQVGRVRLRVTAPGPIPPLPSTRLTAWASSMLPVKGVGCESENQPWLPEAKGVLWGRRIRTVWATHNAMSTGNSVIT